MSSSDKEKAVLVLLALWWLLRAKEQVTTEIDFPPAPEGNCYDVETGSYYVGDC